MRKYLLIPLLILCFSGVAYTLLRPTGHEFTKDQCATCHAVTPVKGKRDTLRMKASLQSLCSRCHPNQENALSHPVEMVPSSGVILPADLPLSWEGKMTCGTCHDIHSAPDSGFTGKWNFLRRRTTGSAFCSSCHDDSGTRAETSSGHAQSLGAAHTKYVPSTEGLNIDKASMICLSCHDGTMASYSNVKVGSWKHGVALSRYDSEGSHPIGINYRRALKNHGGLRPVEQLNPVIKLIEGKVSCRSCHDMFATTYKKLVVTMQGSRLCLECHDK